MCIQKHMFMEGIEEFMQDQMLKVAGARSMFAGRSRFAWKSHAGEASSSSSSRPMLELRPIREEPETGNKAGMSFELKWDLIAEEPHQATIDSPLFRPPARDSGPK